MKSTLVIGGGGFIGTELVRFLANNGRDVTVLDVKQFTLDPLMSNVRYVHGDFSDTKILDALIRRDVEVIHLAYSSVPNTSFDNPLQDLNQNLSPILGMLKMIAERGGLFVFVSSGGTVYGEAKYLPIDELHPTRPISPYGITKLTIENYAYLYSVTHDLKYICIRPANPYGIGQKPFTGQGFISTAIGMVMRGESINIYGEEGTVRDYVYVTDLVEAIAKIIDLGLVNETYNVGSGIGRSNLDVVNAFTPLLESRGFKVNVNHLPSRLFDVKKNVLDSRKLIEKTGWQQRIEFLDGLNMVLNWMSVN